MERLWAGEYKWGVIDAINFRLLCLPSAEEYGLVSEAVGFQMAIGNRPDRAREVIYTLRQMGSEAYSLKTEREKDAVERWSRWYTKTLEDVAHGVELPQAEKQLEKTEVKADPDSEKVKAARSQLKDMF